MSTNIYHKFRTFIADQIFESVSEPANTAYYIVLGKTTPWANDNSPPSPNTFTHFSDHMFNKEFVSGKKVDENDISYVVDRYNWVANTLYQQYDHEVSTLYTTNNNFYALTSDLNVYKCLFNNNNARSTVRPTGVSLTPFTTGDGYTWKYLYSITSGEAEKFLSRSFMPVKYLKTDNDSIQYDVQTQAIDGALQVIEVTNSGSDYRAYDDGTIATVVNSTAVTLATTANNVQDNHYANSGFYIKAGTGAGQYRIVNNYIASTRTLVVTQAFSPALQSGGATPSQYKISPQVKITSPDGSGAVAFSEVDPSTNTVSNVTVVSVGSKYRRANVEIFAKSEHGNGATARAIIGPFGGHGNNAVKELGAERLAFNAIFSGTEGNTVPKSMTFRQISLLKDLRFKGATDEGVLSDTDSNTNIQFTTRLRHSSGSGFEVNEMIAGQTSKAEGRVVFANSTTTTLVAVEGNFVGNETLVGNTTSGFNPTIDGDGVLESDMINSSGELLFVQNIKPVTRNEDQVEDIKIILDF